MSADTRISKSASSSCPGPRQRWCFAGHIKTAISNRELIARFPGALIITAAGIRREESTTRANAPIAAPEKDLESKTQRRSGLKWNPLADFTLADVDESHARHGVGRNETYGRGMSRHSCKFCIMARPLDLITTSSSRPSASNSHAGWETSRRTCSIATRWPRILEDDRKSDGVVLSQYLRAFANI
jgi:3'-phosphoadenosine 5'-phosphosulfate sulfotransferase (PAPS reductase)/FAD synthetase